MKLDEATKKELIQSIETSLNTFGHEVTKHWVKGKPEEEQADVLKELNQAWRRLEDIQEAIKTGDFDEDGNWK